MAVAFQAMKTVQAKSITVTFSGPATATFTATYTTPETRGMGGELVQIVSSSLDASNTPIDIPCALTTMGTSGIATGQYDLYLYVYCFRKIAVEKGHLVSKTWEPGM